ncbi:hypothetical protein [Pelotalea chapellei]|uniref:Uncharacterized protein n=1 Tax=Pelotalea chapellei TaxID=44671 RepID=A0ABS5UCB3_9BACT|nr:hypothetical protein [Pelotalea chapellei]
MFNNSDLGAEVYKSWTAVQKRDEIAKLVEGYRGGLPVGILCNISELIAGSRKEARKHLHAMLTLEERKAAVEGESGGMHKIVKLFLL